MQRICANGWCKQSFEVTDENRAVLTEICSVISPDGSIPVDICPSCRYQQRLAWRNERSLYRRTCDATGEPIVAMFQPNITNPPVYSPAAWWSDNWDATTYGRDIDWNRPFFEQFAELYSVVPQISLNISQNENADYTNGSSNNKNCYMLFSSDFNENCHYGMWNQRCDNCIDCAYIDECHHCYELMSGRNCYACSFSQNLHNCSNVQFSRDCVGCSYCFGCTNLRHKEYCFFNEQLTKEEYTRRMEEHSLGKHSSKIDILGKARVFLQKQPHPFAVGTQNEASAGDYLFQCGSVAGSFNCRESQHLFDCQDTWKAYTCADVTETLDVHHCYFVEASGWSSNVLYSTQIIDTHDAAYSSHCMHSHSLFGCVGLRRKSYCILNKQYSKEEYASLIPKFTQHMRQTEEWGRYLPSRFSPFGYNETVAMEYFPLTKEQAIERGFRWSDYGAPLPQADKTINAKDLPESILDTPDDILNWAIICESTGKPYRLVQQELSFYRRWNLPIPRLHPDERHRRRMALRNPRELYDRLCAKCAKTLRTTYAPDRPEIVYCEECYLSTVY